MKKLLCWLGIHKWRVLAWIPGGPDDSGLQLKCVRCGKHARKRYLGLFD